MTAGQPMFAPDFRALFESAPGAYLVLSPALMIVAASEGYLSATMTKRRDILGRHIFEVFPGNPEDPGATGVNNLRASLRCVLENRTADTMEVQRYDIRRPASEGGAFEVRHWRPVNSPVLGPNGGVRYIIHHVEDVTAQLEADLELRKLHEELESRVEARTAELRAAHEALHNSEAQLRQSQKLEAIGRLAGGFAHDFNNVLSVILSYCEFLVPAAGSNETMLADIEEIRRAGHRATALTRQMLAFSRQQMLDPRVLDLNGAVADVSKMLARVLGEDIELEALPMEGLGSVKADPGQIEQVLMNLVVNARDAMPRGGRLTIATANVELDDTFAARHLGVMPGPYVRLSVRDTGIGMDEATQARVFEPFFTTKEDKGTGLGLSTVFGIVKQSGGHIWMRSKLGQGTSFDIDLPRIEGAASVDLTPSGTRPVAAVQGTETILLVEDQDQVRAVALGILKRAGYQVLGASHPAEALALCELHQGEIHLLLTDVVMPGMSGPQLAARVSDLRPGVKFLFMSGYTDGVILHHGVLDSGVALLQKPFTPESLTRKVDAVLNGERQAPRAAPAE